MRGGHVKRWLLLAILGVAVAAPARAAEEAAPDGPELTRLLREFLEGASRNDPAAHERFWADDLVYTGSSGKRRFKPEILADVRKAGPAKPDAAAPVYTAEEVRIRQYGEAAVVAFRLVGTTARDGKTEVENYLNTGTFVRRGGRWQVVAWQATRMAPAETKTDAPAEKKQ
jgi:hypothetical protein